MASDDRVQVSVIMSAYNEEELVERAIDSILQQEFKPFELIVVNDGSSDRTGSILSRLASCDSRLKIIDKEHGGLIDALSIGIARSRAALIARMDADDVSHPERLKKQVAFMSDHPSVVLLGTACRIEDRKGTVTGIYHPPTDDSAIKRAMVRDNPMVHSSVMMRRAAFDLAGGYDAGSFFEDYDLWIRIVAYGACANLPEPLVTRREDDNLNTRAIWKDRSLCRVYRERLRCQWRAARHLGMTVGGILQMARTAVLFSFASFGGQRRTP